MKTRMKKTPVKPSPSRSKRDERIPPSADKGGEVRICHRGAFPIAVRFHDLPTTELVVIENVDALHWVIPNVFGKFVKVSPLLKASEAQLFNGSEIRAELEKEGARAVILAPRIVPDIRKIRNEEEVKSKTVHEIVELWFNEQKIDDDDRFIAKNLLFGLMESEGL